MSNDKNLKPQVVPSIYEIQERLKKTGLSERDLVTLIQDRTNPRLSRSQIQNTLQALRGIEKQLEMK